ncbi:MAG: hypothetical protein R6U96_04380 [Promethearchaeia archaeon]
MNEIEILRKKTELLVKGVNVSHDLLKHLDFVRKGGAGPLNGKYFLLDADKTLANVPLWNEKSSHSDLYLKYSGGSMFEVFDEKNKLFDRIELIESPAFYELETSDGIPMKKIALMHGIDCLASTIYQKCKHWSCGKACKFCGIELSLQNDKTILEKNGRQLSEVISAAKMEERCTHLTLTSGTVQSKGKGAEKYIRILENLNEKFPNLPIHVQIEPVNDFHYLSSLKEAGADTIGIHIELLNKKLRKQITPGKSNISWETFKKNWKFALNTFGPNQVESYVLYGFRKDPAKFIQDVERIISLGVIPYITPVRKTGNNDLPLYPITINDMVFVYRMVAIMMKNYGVNPLAHKAGCVRCGGCSTINEAYKLIV